MLEKETTKKEKTKMADQRILANWEERGEITWWNVKPVVLKELRTQNYPKPKQNPNLPQNLIIEGDCGPVMKTLCAGKFRLKGRVDLMLWDPPYNTGKGEKGNTGNGFIYNDKHYQNKELARKLKDDSSEAEWVKADIAVTDKDLSRHSKWLNFMELRLDLAKRLLAPTGVIAVHIGYQELFRLGLLMDQIFGEENRLGIVNWECAYSPKNDNKGIPSTTDYVLIYAKDKDVCYRGTLERNESSNAKYIGHTWDGDPYPWRPDNFSASSGTGSYRYGIENPFTGELQFPPHGAYWRRPVATTKQILEQWGVKYEWVEKKNSLVVVSTDRSKIQKVLKEGPWPEIYFGKDGNGRPTPKRYLHKLKHEGRVIGTYWPSEEILDEEDIEVFSEALSHEISGHNDAGKKLLKAIMGDCPFDTPKPLKLTERLIKLFCPPTGTVLDAFGGSGTTAHGVLSLNQKEDANRRFVLIEYFPQKESKQPAYAHTITAERVRRVISGEWETPRKDTEPLPGQFAFYQEGEVVSKKEILESSRIQLIDTILSLHDVNGYTSQIPTEAKYVIGTTANHRPIVLVWDGPEKSHFTKEIYKEVMVEVKNLGLQNYPVEVYSGTNKWSEGATYHHNRIPEDILLKLEIEA